MSDSCQKKSLSAYSSRLGCDWLDLDLSASTHATLELSGSLKSSSPRLNFPVSRPLKEKWGERKEGERGREREREREGGREGGREGRREKEESVDYS